MRAIRLVADGPFFGLKNCESNPFLRERNCYLCSPFRKMFSGKGYLVKN